MNTVKFTLAFLLSALCANAADYTLSWVGSVTVGTSNKIFVSRHPFQGQPITNAMFSAMIGTTNRVPINLTSGVWRIAICAVLDGVESDPAAIAIEVPSLKPVPEKPTTLKAEAKP